ncbi:MAG: bifunctional 2-polyprenyl-6-hydroxyphenol methylase/3-demethylubiquinol 3-O-methyltransferase UbiG, partial [Brachymonas sp.]|nr:bifunctional 2-polyprenyl-6-hydroxyphenol methylase/3-demethylubiquinol 3-O-methyltransferase UbiG [Brachymonas sp.]
EESLQVASAHAAKNHVAGLNYRCIGVEDLAREQPQSFDVVTCMEMLEHVPDPTSVVRACAALVKPGGWVFFSTLARNPKSFLYAIVGAEYVLRLLPRGTHNYDKFIKPSELVRYARQAGLQPVATEGLHYNPLTQHYWLGQGVDVNYMLACRKPA